MTTWESKTGTWPERRLPAKLELYLAAGGLAVVALLTALGAPSQYWRTAGWLAGAVGVVYALVARAARRREERDRQLLVAELQAMLMDRVNNQLQVVHAALGELAEDREACEQVATALEASRAIARTLEELSLERLSGWQRTYQRGAWTGPRRSPIVPAI